MLDNHIIFYLAYSVLFIKQHQSYDICNLHILCLISCFGCLYQLSSEADHSDGDNVLMLGQPDLHQGEEPQ